LFGKVYSLCRSNRTYVRVGVSKRRDEANEMTTYLSDYQTFNSTQELNHHVRQHEKAHVGTLTASHRQVLRFIARYSVKYAGASHLKAATIAEGTDKSERTIRRILNVLERLDIIKRIKTTRPKSGGSGANIIVIQPFVSHRMTGREVDEKARQNNVSTQVTENEPCIKRDNSNYILDTGFKNAIPTPVYDVLAPFYNAKDIQRLTGIVFRAKASISRSIRLEDHVEPFRTVVLDIVRRFKAGNIRSVDSYLYVSLRKLFRRLHVEDAWTWS
jgi:hypothetical protein